MHAIYGAILGDLAGQPHEFPARGGIRENVLIHNPSSSFTDDTILTLASAYSIVHDAPLEYCYKYFGNKYNGDYYGKGFKEWLSKPEGTKGDSWGNGCLMRVSPFMYLKEPLPKLIESVICSHNSHVAIDSVIRLYRAYKMAERYNYHEVDTFTKFEVKADKTLDFCINIYGVLDLDTRGYIKRVIECGGDTDTNASIVGAISAFQQKDLNNEDISYVRSKLDYFLLKVLDEFESYLKIKKLI